VEAASQATSQTEITRLGVEITRLGVAQSEITRLGVEITRLRDALHSSYLGAAAATTKYDEAKGVAQSEITRLGVEITRLRDAHHSSYLRAAASTTKYDEDKALQEKMKNARKVKDEVDVEASTSGVGLPANEPLEETEPGQGHARNGSVDSSPNSKRRRTPLAESGHLTARADGAIDTTDVSCR
jgi:hypothetical protein